MVQSYPDSLTNKSKYTQGSAQTATKSINGFGSAPTTTTNAQQHQNHYSSTSKGFNSNTLRKGPSFHQQMQNISTPTAATITASIEPEEMSHPNVMNTGYN